MSSAWDGKDGEEVYQVAEGKCATWGQDVVCPLGFVQRELYEVLSLCCCLCSSQCPPRGGRQPDQMAVALPGYVSPPFVFVVRFCRALLWVSRYESPSMGRM